MFLFAIHKFEKLASASLPLIQLWSWFIGMGILTTPWHVLGLLGQPRRISRVAYNYLLTLAWDPYELAMILGGLVLLASACLFIYILAKTQTGDVPESDRTVAYAEPIHPLVHLPELLNDFRTWNWTILVFMMVAFTYPILQFFFLDTFDSNAWGY